MSGRFTFTAGNTLTAAQLNTNVMDGIPYKIVAGTASVTGSLAVTFAASFTSGVTPIMSVAVLSGDGTISSSASYSALSNTGVTINCWKGTAASTSSRTVSFMAIQMTSTTGAGNS